VVASNLDEDLLHAELIRSSKHNLLNIPLSEVGEVLDLQLGLVLKKIMKVVRTACAVFFSRY